MKYKVGDMVRVKSDLESGKKYANISLLNSMEVYIGKIGKIEKVISRNNNYFLDNGFYWSEEMLEPAYQEGGLCNRFKGGKIAYSKDGASLVEITTPEKSVSIEKQFMNNTFKDSLDSALDAWCKLAGMTVMHFKNNSSIKVISKEDKIMPIKFTFTTKEGYRIDKTNNTKIPTITTIVEDTKYGNSATATCDKVDYDERQGVLEALAQLCCKGSFDKEYKKAIKINKIEDEIKRTCSYCGQIFDTPEERKAHENWHIERRKARHERYLLRKRAKEIAFEETAQKMAKEIIKENK